MKELDFQWDPRKDVENQRKHGVSFQEAESAFKDENAIQYFDPDHSDKEDRFLLLGLCTKLRLLVVCHCFLESELIVRIISARKANAREERHYREINR